jgi:hypothetical protein
MPPEAEAAFLLILVQPHREVLEDHLALVEMAVLLVLTQHLEVQIPVLAAAAAAITALQEL